MTQIRGQFIIQTSCFVHIQEWGYLSIWFWRIYPTVTRICQWVLLTNQLLPHSSKQPFRISMPYCLAESLFSICKFHFQQFSFYFHLRNPTWLLWKWHPFSFLLVAIGRQSDSYLSWFWISQMLCFLKKQYYSWCLNQCSLLLPDQYF